MSDNINKILKDLYELDSSFKEHEDELVKIVNKLLESRPSIQIDQMFVEKLRQSVLKKAEELKMEEANSRLFNFMQFKNFAFIGVGAIVMLLIMLPVLINDQQVANVQFESEKTKIAKLEDGAFGSLSGQTNTTNEESMLSSDTSISDGMVSEKMAVGYGGGGVSVSTERAMDIDYETINYEYVYTGDNFSLEEDSVPVYQRVTVDDLGKKYANQLADFDFGILNTGKFKDTEVMSMNIAEDREFGYSVYFNFSDGSLSINANWNEWPRDNDQMKESDLLSSDELINIADNFVNDYSFDMSDYGDPIVNDNWKRSYGESDYIPDAIDVIYPFKIEDREVYDDSGNPTGMTVNVNMRYKKVSSVHGIYRSDFNFSDYEAETDYNKVIKVAENGGIWSSYSYNDPDKTITLELGTPERGLVRHWHYTGDGEKGSSELYAEALIFPITNLDEIEETFYKKYIVVPLVKEILDTIDLSDNEVIEPMPLLRGEMIDIDE
jgi:hypothetical protein